MDRKKCLGRQIKERKKLSFYKIFQSATDLSSECMRVIPYNFMRRVSHKDFSYKMVIKAQWGSFWEVQISKNPRFYYMDKRGWNQFVSDNALGENEFVTFTHDGNMRFGVNIYSQNGKEIFLPRKMAASSGVKKEQGESSYKVVKKEVETSDSMGRVEIEVRKKKADESKTSKKKVVNSAESKKKEIMSKMLKDGVPDFSITITRSYLMYLAIPKQFVVEHIPNEATVFTIHHPNGNSSWEVISLVRKARTIFSSGWSALAREYPLIVGESYTFKLIKPTEIILVISTEAGEGITVIN